MKSRRNGTEVDFESRRNGSRRNGSRRNGTNHRRNGSRRNGSRRNGSDSFDHLVCMINQIPGHRMQLFLKNPS